MPQPSKIPSAFAASGDKNVIPESTKTTGLASWREGFPAITSAPFSEGGIAPKRADFNGIFNALSQSVIWLQQGGVYAYDVNTDYEAGNVVLDAGGLYVANAGNGPSSVVVQPSTDATGATWKLVRLDLATQIAAGYMSAADKTKLDGLISTDATPTAAGYMSAADKTRLDSVILTDATQTAAGYMSAEDKNKLDGLISTDATQSAAGYMSAADKTKLDGLISTDATPTAAGYMSAADKTKLDGLIVHNILPPVGVVMWLSGNTVPDGCLAADGAAVSRTTYAELFTVIGTTWGEGDGSTTFNLPDARGRVPEGAQTAGGYNAPGLPNITGEVMMHSATTGTNMEGVIGAFYPKNTLSSFRDGGPLVTVSGVSSIPSFTLNASRSSSIYGGSSTVQPASVKLLPVIVYRSNAQLPIRS